MFLLIGAATLGIFLVRKFFARGATPKDPPLQQVEWKKDVVYLVQFPISPEVRTISPFSLKLETWLRMVGLPYENIYDTTMSKKRQIPYIEFNGKQIPDSNLAIQFLKEYFKESHPNVVAEETQLSAADLAIGHLAKMMVENHTCLTGFYWRYGLKMEEFFDKALSLSKDLFPKIGLLFFRHMTPKIIRLRLHLHGLTRHSDEEIEKFAFEDLTALSNLLGDKKYFLGDSPSTIDCTLYGHLAQFLFIPMDFPQKIYMRQNCKNLIDYMDRLKTEFWPDWSEACQKKCMIGKLGRGLNKEEIQWD